MATLPAPEPLSSPPLFINVFADVPSTDPTVTHFIQDGTGFTPNTTADVTVTPGGFTFTNLRVRFISATRILISATCDNPINFIAAPIDSTIIVTTNTDGVIASSSEAFPVLLRQAPQPTFSVGIPQNIHTVEGDNATLFLPISGLEGTLTAAVTSSDGKAVWSVVKATQLKITKRVRLTVNCVITSVPVLSAPIVPEDLFDTPLTAFLSITFFSDDGTVLDLPPVPVIYVADPEDITDS